MGKFALRGLAQSMARELSPQGIHVAHFVIDGGIRSAVRTERPTGRTRCSIPTHRLELLERAAAAAQRLDLELELRPWVEEILAELSGSKDRGGTSWEGWPMTHLGRAIAIATFSNHGRKRDLLQREPPTGAGNILWVTSMCFSKRTSLHRRGSA